MRLDELDQRPLKKIAAHLRLYCMPFLQAINYELFQYTLWRGLSQQSESDIFVINCPVNRQPKDTPIELHTEADNWFKKKTGIAFRSNAFFVTGSYSEAKGYGSASYNGDQFGDEFIFIPIGPYSFCWSERIHDFYAMTEGEVDTIYNSYTGPDLSEKLKEWAEDKLGSGAYQYNTNMKDAIMSQNEIMIHCTKAYFINKKFQNSLPQIQELCIRS